MMKRDILVKFGAAVKASRTQLGLSQQELATRAKLHRTYISDVERGARNISLLTIQRLARALKSSVPALCSELGGQTGTVAAKNGGPKQKAA